MNNRARFSSISPAPPAVRLAAVDTPLKRRLQRAPIRVPDPRVDVHGFTWLIAVLVGLAALGYELGWLWLTLGAGVGFLFACWRIKFVYDRGFDALYEDAREFQDSMPPPVDSDPELIVQVQTVEGSLRFAPNDSFKGFRADDWSRLAASLLDKGKVTKTLLEGLGLWTNINGAGRSHDYRYQDVSADLRWLRFVDDQNELTPDGVAFLSRYAPPTPERGR